MNNHSEFLRGHPIFNFRSPLEIPPDLSLISVKDPRNGHSPVDHCSPPSNDGRRNIMALRESDIILAVGREIRITSLADTGAVGRQRRSYKVHFACSMLSSATHALT